MSSVTRRLEAPSVAPSALREASAVVLLCMGLMTLLSLASYHASDVSLNASGNGVVRNWIGPAGAYWADVLLQATGLGAYALGFALVLAGGRALGGRRILPGLREAGGLLLLTVSVGLLAQLALWDHPHPYPPGGALGAIFGQALRNRFAVLGAYILATSMLLLSLALTAEGVLMGLGLRSWDLMRRLGALFGAGWQWLCGLPGRVAKAQAAQPRPRLMRVAEAAPTKKRNARVRVAGAEDDKAKAEAPDAHEAAAGEAGDGTMVSPRLRGRKPVLAQVSAPRSPLSLVKGDAGDDDDDDASGPDAELPNAAALADSDSDDAASDDVDEIFGGVPKKIAGGDADTGAPAGASAVPAPKPARVRKTTLSEPQIVDARPEVDVASLDCAPEAHKAKAEAKTFELPPTSLLDFQASVREPVDPEKLRDNAVRLTKTLKDYGIDGHVREIRPGPVVTMYEYVPGPGIKLSKIASLADDLAMSMEAMRVRIVAPIPGKGAVGIEIPNDTRETVYLKEIIAHDAFRKAKSHLTMALGKDIEGGSYVADLARMPHLLVAGATGAGKSVSINAMIMSVLFKATPAEVRMIMVDPKMLELSVYEGIPHLLLPVVTDPKKAALALRWAVEEMERRYELLSEVGVRSIDGYNNKVRAAQERGAPVTVQNPTDPDLPAKVCEPLPYLLVIVDELADLMMVASREVESSIMRLAQMARAAGIHLILATQRPSVDVLTGVIKANFPTRIAFQVASRHDSRTIIDANGAEHLLGRGDMLYLSPGAGGMLRVHGAYVSDEEIERAVKFLREQGRPEYDESILAPRGDDADGEGEQEDTFHDEMYDQAVAIVAETRQASISMIQRRLRIGYNRSARMVERMEHEGIVGPADGAKPRDVLISPMSA